MSERIELAKKLIAQQKKFMAYEKANGFDPKDLYIPADDHELKGYKEAYAEDAMALLEIAHKEKGSHRYTVS